MASDKALRFIGITRINSGGSEPAQDVLAVEEPLEIRVAGRAIAVVMRTPGHDRELAAGFLVTEGVVRHRDAIIDMIHCRPEGGAPDPNILDVILAEGAPLDLERLSRNVFTSSSCGICSKASIAAVQAQFPRITERFLPAWSVIASLPPTAAQAQVGFAASGGLHAAALFDHTGKLLVLREDVGRHNALDKVIGHFLLAAQLPRSGDILLVSGRVSFEIMQKALAAGIPCVAAISAPTSAAVAFAGASGQTLIGFLRGAAPNAPATRMNVYTGEIPPD